MGYARGRGEGGINDPPSMRSADHPQNPAGPKGENVVIFASNNEQFYRTQYAEAACNVSLSEY